MSQTITQYRRIFYGISAGLLLLSGCATAPAPVAEIDAARQAISRAQAVDAENYAAEPFAQARMNLSQAQAALSDRRDMDARRLALLAEADADLAVAQSLHTMAQHELNQRREEMRALERRLQEGQ